jgi:hypothetical protein
MILPLRLQVNPRPRISCCSRNGADLVARFWSLRVRAGRHRDPASPSQGILSVGPGLGFGAIGWGLALSAPHHKPPGLITRLGLAFTVGLPDSTQETRMNRPQNALLARLRQGGHRLLAETSRGHRLLRCSARRSSLEPPVAPASRVGSTGSNAGPDLRFYVPTCCSTSHDADGAGVPESDARR